MMTTATSALRSPPDTRALGDSGPRRHVAEHRVGALDEYVDAALVAMKENRVRRVPWSTTRARERVDFDSMTQSATRASGPRRLPRKRLWQVRAPPPPDDDDKNTGPAAGRS